MTDWGPDVLKTWPPEKPEHAPPFVIVNQWNRAWPIGFATGYSFDESESADLCVKYVQESQLAAHRLALAALVEAGERITVQADIYEAQIVRKPDGQIIDTVKIDALRSALAEGKKVLGE